MIVWQIPQSSTFLNPLWLLSESKILNTPLCAEPLIIGKMPMSCRFLVGDGLGNIKSLQYNPRCTDGDKMELKNVHLWRGEKSTSIQALKHYSGSQNLVRSTPLNLIILPILKSKGSCSLFEWNNYAIETERRFPHDGHSMGWTTHENWRSICWTRFVDKVGLLCPLHYELLLIR